MVEAGRTFTSSTQADTAVTPRALGAQKRGSAAVDHEFKPPSTPGQPADVTLTVQQSLQDRALPAAFHSGPPLYAKPKLLKLYQWVQHGRAGPRLDRGCSGRVDISKAFLR